MDKKQHSMDMEGLVFDFILIFIFIILPIIFGWALYYIPKIFGDKGIGKILSFSYFIVYIYFFVSIRFPEALFFKSDARAILKEQQMILKDDFTINDVNLGIGIHSDDNFDQFKITVSDRDKENIIKQIKHSKNFTICFDEENCPKIDRSNIYYGKSTIINYETSDSYIREYFKTFGKGKSPMNGWIIISKNDNTIYCSQ